MAIIAARIDGRLVHGQVANLWTTKLGATRIMVVDEAASKSDIDKSGLRMATQMVFACLFSMLPQQQTTF